MGLHVLSSDHIQPERDHLDAFVCREDAFNSGGEDDVDVEVIAFEGALESERIDGDESVKRGRTRRKGEKEERAKRAKGRQLDEHGWRGDDLRQEGRGSTYGY
jgi:hypothetical protein